MNITTNQYEFKCNKYVHLTGSFLLLANQGLVYPKAVNIISWKCERLNFTADIYNLRFVRIGSKLLRAICYAKLQYYVTIMQSCSQQNDGFDCKSYNC